VASCSRSGYTCPRHYALPYIVVVVVLLAAATALAAPSVGLAIFIASDLLSLAILVAGPPTHLGTIAVWQAAKPASVLGD